MSIQTVVSRLAGKRRYLASYTSLAETPAAWFALLRLGLVRFEVFRPKAQGAVIRRNWSARLRRLNGKAVHLSLVDVCHLAIFDEIFLESSYDLQRVPFEPDFIFDVGAHIGLFTLLASNRWPHTTILSIEPHPLNAEFARINISKNGLQASVLEAAASDQRGYMGFHYGNGMGHLSQNEKTTVPVVDLPGLMSAIPSEKTLLKMDIEGGELTLMPKVFPVLPKKCAVFIELHGSEEKCLEIMNQAVHFGFDSTILRQRRADASAICFIDAFFIR